MSSEIELKGATGWSLDILDILKDREKIPRTLCCDRADCKRVLKDPFQLECGHRYCKSCLEILQSLPEQEQLCHGCLSDNESELIDNTGSEQATEENQLTDVINSNAKINFAHAFRDIAAIKELSRLDIFCPYGCGQPDLKYRDMESHMETCLHRRVICAHCKVKTEFRLLQQHERTECQNCSVQCPYNCGQTGITASQLCEHKVKCEKRPEVCRFCKSVISEESLYMHLQKCISDCPNGLPKSYSYKPLIQQLNENLDYYLAHITRTYAAISSIMSEPEKWRGSSVLEKDELTNRSIIEKELSDLSEKLLILMQNSEIMNQCLMNSLDQAKEPSLKKMTQTSILDSLEKVITELAEAVNLMDSYMMIYREAEKRLLGQDLMKSEMIRKLERQAQRSDAMTAEHKFRLEEFQQTSFDGHLIWKVESVMYSKESAVKGERYSRYSPPFYSSPQGYKMCLRLYLNGDGKGKHTHISLFFVVMRGEHDALLKWPFPHKVTMTLRNQTNRKPDIIERFRPDPSSDSFQKPRSERNIASGCPQFADQVEVYSQENGFLKDDVLFFDVTVDLTDAS